MLRDGRQAGNERKGSIGGALPERSQKPRGLSWLLGCGASRSHARLLGRFRHHGIHGMHSLLQLLPDGLQGRQKGGGGGDVMELGMGAWWEGSAGTQ